MRNNVDNLNYLNNKRGDKIKIHVEEALGGHSIARHGHNLLLSDMELRVLGQHPAFPQSRSALKFDSEAIHQASLSKAFKEHKTEIDAHFANGGGYREWDSQLSGRIGEGYTNTGTRRMPISQYVTTDIVRIAFKPDANNPSGYIMDSGYPLYE